MAHPLDGSREKIRRAGDHLQTLEVETLRYVEEHPFTLAIRTDKKTGIQLITAHSRRRPPEDPPQRLGVIVGDILHNLRSALDHLVWQLAELGEGAAEYKNQFPIYDTKKKYLQKVGTTLHGVAAEHRETIEGLQPYHEHGEGLALRIIGDLNNIDKHRVVHTVKHVAATGPDSIQIENATQVEMSGADFTRLDDGAVLYRIHSADVIDPSKPVNIHTEVGYTLIFGDPAVLAANRGDLMTCRDAVSNIVEHFAPFFDKPDVSAPDETP